MTKMFSLENRVALVTGASRGLGLAMAKPLKENGAHVIINARDAAALATAATSIGAQPLAFDVSMLLPHRKALEGIVRNTAISIYWSTTPVSASAAIWSNGRTMISDRVSSSISLPAFAWPAMPPPQLLQKLGALSIPDPWPPFLAAPPSTPMWQPRRGCTD